MATKIEVKGVIIPSDHAWLYDWLGIDYTSPKKVNSQLAAAQGDDLEVLINSPGGSVFDGSEIFYALKDHSGKVTVKIVGVAASAASVIAMAGDRVLIAPTAQIMIHNVMMGNEGDYRDMDHASETLQKANETLRNAYKLKTGADDQTLKAMMDHETWLTPDEAVEKGFADAVMFTEPVQMAASAGGLISPTLMNQLRQKLAPIIKPKAASESELLMTEFNLLNLRRVD